MAYRSETDAEMRERREGVRLALVALLQPATQSLEAVDRSQHWQPVPAANAARRAQGLTDPHPDSVLFSAFVALMRRRYLEVVEHGGTDFNGSTDLYPARFEACQRQLTGLIKLELPGALRELLQTMQPVLARCVEASRDVRGRKQVDLAD